MIEKKKIPSKYQNQKIVFLKEVKPFKIACLYLYLAT